MIPKVFKLDLSNVARGVAAAPTVASVCEEEGTELTSGPEYDQVKNEVAPYSITPRTFVKRTLLHIGDGCSRFVDKYR